MNFRGGKFSKSRGWTVDVPYFLSKYDPDPLRYYLTAVAPQSKDKGSIRSLTQPPPSLIAAHR